MQALEILRDRWADDHWRVAWTERSLAVLLLAEGELASARVLLTHAYSSLQQAKRAGNWQIAEVESVLGALLAAEGRFAEAEACLVEGYRVLREARGESASYTRVARLRIVELYDAWGRPEKAAPFRTESIPTSAPNTPKESTAIE